MGMMPTEKEIEEKPLTRGIYGHIFLIRCTKTGLSTYCGQCLKAFSMCDEIEKKTRKYAERQADFR